MKRLLLLFLFPAILSSFCQKDKYLYNFSDNGVNLRSSPSPQSTVSTVIPFGAKVQIIRRNPTVEQIGDSRGKWIKVDFNGSSGWVFDPFFYSVSPEDALSNFRNFYTAEMELFLQDYEESNFFKEPNSLTRKVMTNALKKPKSVSITKSRYNIVLVQYPKFDHMDSMGTPIVEPWIFTGHKWERLLSKEEVFFLGGRTVELIYLNDDLLPDILISSGCCSSGKIRVYISETERKFQKIDLDLTDDVLISEVNKNGNCESGGFTVVMDSKTTRKYHFDCVNGKLVFNDA